jgi:hypothetical protein
VSGRRKCIDLGNGARIRESTKAAAAFHRQQQAENLAMKRRIEADTCDLGPWESPEGLGPPDILAHGDDGRRQDRSLVALRRRLHGRP